MQIIVPMSGFGERFRRAGYDIPKPLIEIEGKPIIAHVIDMFSQEDDFIFICNEEHLSTPEYHMEDILKKYCPSAKIIGIPPHKLGPVHAVLQLEELIDTNQATIVNYCDFTCFWDWEHFQKFTETTGCDGAIPAYKNFHPHTLGTTNYAYIRENAGVILDIQEKQPYTDNRMDEYASSGTYYFKTGQIMLDAFKETKKQELMTGGEYYVSLTYKPLLAKDDKILVYDLQHFMQWGTPEDVQEYNNWSQTFSRQVDTSKEEQNGAVIIPMAGLGLRFQREGYLETKPLISVSGLPMVLQATNNLPKAEKYVFVLRKDMQGYQEISELLIKTYPNSAVKILAEVTDGQATSALIGLETLEESNQGITYEPITFGACDFGSNYSKTELQNLIDDESVDIIVWGVRNNTNAQRYPEMFGWVEENEGGITNISVKKPLNDPSNDPIILGSFTFKSASVFKKIIHRMYERKAKVNGEYYLDTMINDAIAMGLNCRLFEVDDYLSWGTPNDLKTFEYWQSCFHKWPSHQYSLDLDPRIPKESLPQLKQKYEKTIPIIPKVDVILDNSDTVR